MIDWHSHILPGMDDGSRNVDESRSMLKALGEQGIETIIATPHFDADSDSVDTFLERRSVAHQLLHEACMENSQRILCGAEVRYYPGIRKLVGLERLSIESTNLLLLEMPVDRWSTNTIKEITNLAGTRSLTIILAHIERYIFLQQKGTLEHLCENGVRMQVNASFFHSCLTKRKALGLLATGKIHFIGSDCHNMTSRPPRIGEAYQLIERRMGDRFTSQMNAYGYSMLNVNKG